MKFYIYTHIRLDTNQPFYVGKGTRGRARSKNGRNKWWRAIVEKAGYRIEINQEGLTERQALNGEKLMISALRKFFTLCNLTEGGDGKLGYLTSEETKMKMSQSHTGKRRSEEARLSMSRAALIRNMDRVIPVFYQVTCIKTGDTRVVRYKDLAAEGFNPGGISRQILGQIKQHKGHTFVKLEGEPNVRH